MLGNSFLLIFSFHYLISTFLKQFSLSLFEDQLISADFNQNITFKKKMDKNLIFEHLIKVNFVLTFTQKLELL